MRTRVSLLQTLAEELRDKSKDYLGADIVVGSGKPENGHAGTRFIDTVRKALTARVRSQSENNLQWQPTSVQAVKKQPPIPELTTPSVRELDTS